ncbi:hypothetical protein BJ085DRAFT_32138 [Dimargaris cristalligena]|uniref:Homeodomain-like protein n=1 Tax=Dimargaris cristalligena TaxID=215637 RepID=A0A4P9ZLJ9_9FUNG|nr:hypothetical protein BJ085DRAFT_32138 [Dimargaris cristalligena]|eukprot:RKP34013.1 hypothetical protein BJ085DRAFT_32138 [Dimargaris cristalligena]
MVNSIGLPNLSAIFDYWCFWTEVPPHYLPSWLSGGLHGGLPRPAGGTFRSRNNKVSWFIANSSEWERAAPLPRTTKTRWTPEEDVRLIQAVEKFGGKNWSAVAAQVGTRNRVCCNQRSRKIMRDPTSVTTVTPELLADVDQLLRRYNHDWSKVLPHYPHFKPYQIRSRYALWLNRTSQFSRIWDTVELERLRTAVAQLGPFRWFDVAQVVQTKSFTQCSLQWKKFTLLATRKATTLEERVRILFFLAVFHPDHIHPIVPQWLTWLPASLQDRGLQPGVHINWLVAAQWLLLTRTSGQSGAVGSKGPTRPVPPVRHEPKTAPHGDKTAHIHSGLHPAV